MPNCFVIFVAFTLAVGISYGEEFPRPKTEQPEARSFLLSQTDEPRPERRLQSAGDENKFGKTFSGARAERKHLEKFRLSKLLELLELTKEQRKEFLPQFRETRKQHHRTIRNKVRAVEKLGQLLKQKKSSEREIQKLIDEISDFEKQKIRQQESFLTGCRGILTPVQFGKLIVFQDRFELRMLGKLRGFRDRKEQMFSRQRRPGSSTKERQDSNFINNDSNH